MDLDTYTEIREFLRAGDVDLVAVSKTKPPEDILALYNTGQRIFGENRVEELVKKQPLLPSDIEWHMIGHLQSRKVKRIAPFVDLIHSVDSEKLMTIVNKEGIKNARRIDILLQFHIAKEKSKYGFEEAEVHDILTRHPVAEMRGIRIRGVMGMATFTDNEEQVRSEFRQLKDIYNRLQSNYFQSVTSFDTISMGMSGDYRIAVEEGSTMVRIGSLIFGPRE